MNKITGYLGLCSVDLIYDDSLDVKVFFHNGNLFFGKADVLM